MTTKPEQTYRIGVVGLGLIGGSFARGLREAGVATWMGAWDADPQVLVRGCELGVIDEGLESLDALIARVDVLILAAPTLASEALLTDVLAKAGPSVCITDVASVKGNLCARVMELPQEQAARFVPGHPIAGSERHGVEAARADLFANHRVILSPLPMTDADALALVSHLWRAVGAEVVEMSVAEHDAILASTSHLPHMLAYALVDALAASPSRHELFRFAAGGFRDFTRIASSDPVMWRDIALANRDALLDSLDHFSSHLSTLREAVEAGDGQALEGMFARAKAARDEFLLDLAQRSATPDPSAGDPGAAPARNKE